MNAPTLEEAARVRAIRGALAASGVPTVAGPHYLGPQAMVYHLAPRPELMARGLRQTEAVEAALDQPGVRLAQDGRWLAVEVPRRHRQVIRLSKLGPALAVTLRDDPITPALDQTTPHGLVAAQTGGGKSEALRTWALLESLRPATRLVLVDLEGESWAPFEGSGHTVAHGEAETAAALAWVHARLGRPAEGRVVLFVDEVQMLGPAAMALVRDVAERGRKHGVHLVLATQHPRHDVLDRRVTANLGARVIGRVADAKAAALVGMPGAERLMGAGDVLVGVPGAVPVRAQVALADDAAWRYMRRVEPVELPAAGIPHEARIAWAREQIAEHGRVSAETIRDHFGVGTTTARRIRDAAAALPTDRVDGRLLQFRAIRATG